MARGESLEALLAPQLRVSRPVAACSRCRCAKIKCDGKLPACTACERAGKADSCSGANDEFAKGKERSYVAALEAASERLQRRIREAKVLQATDPGRQDAVATSYMLGPGHAFPARRVASGGRVHRKEASDVDNLVGDFGFLSVNATSRDFHGFTTTMSFARLLMAVSKIGDVPQVDTRSLPARHSILLHIQFYLNEIFVLMPFFSETDLMTSISSVYANAGRHAKPMDHWMFRMVLAIVSARTSRDKGDAERRAAHEHLSAALGYSEDVLHPGSIAGVQAIMLLVQYSMVDPDLFSCWHLIGFASRAMVDLGLHNEPAAEIRISKDEIELRRRVFYSVYILDRNISMALDRAFSFTDDSASVNLPALPHSTIPSDSGQDTGPQLFLRSLRPCLYLIDIRRVQSALYQETRSSDRSEWASSTGSTYTNSIRKEIRSWVSGMPDTLSDSQATLFRLESLYSEIVALAASCRNPKITDLFRVLIFEYAVQYADQIHPVIEDQNWHAFFTVTDIHRVNYVGHQFINIMWASFDHLLSGTLPRESPVSSQEADQSIAKSPSPPPPNITRSTSGLENSTRAIRFLDKTVAILAYAQRRFGNCCTALKIQFDRESAVLINKLRMKQQELGTVQYITGAPPGLQQRQQMQRMQQQQIQMPQQGETQQQPRFLQQPEMPRGPLPPIGYQSEPRLLQQPEMPREPHPPIGYQSEQRLLQQSEMPLHLSLLRGPHLPIGYQSEPRLLQQAEMPLQLSLPRGPHPPIGYQAEPPSPTNIPLSIAPAPPPPNYSRAPTYESQIETLPQSLRPFPSFLSPSSLQQPDQMCQQDPFLSTHRELSPPSWVSRPVTPIGYGRIGPYERLVPNGVGPSFPAMPESMLPRRTYEFNGTRGNAEDTGGGGGAGGAQ